MTTGFEYNDGGRKEAGYKGNTGDCGVRSLAIALELPYQEVYDKVNDLCLGERKSKRRRGKSSARTGIHSHTFKLIAEAYGLKWIPTMFIGQGCKVHLRADELPKGRIICNVSKHYVAVIDGTIHDLEDCSRGGTRCVYGYYIKATGELTK